MSNTSLKNALKLAKAAEGTVVDKQYLARLQYLAQSKLTWIGADENQLKQDIVTYLNSRGLK